MAFKKKRLTHPLSLPPEFLWNSSCYFSVVVLTQYQILETWTVLQKLPFSSVLLYNCTSDIVYKTFNTRICFEVGCEYRRLKNFSRFRRADLGSRPTRYSQGTYGIWRPPTFYSRWLLVCDSPGHCETIRLHGKGYSAPSLNYYIFLAIFSPMRSLGRTVANCWPVGWYR